MPMIRWKRVQPGHEEVEDEEHLEPAGVEAVGSDPRGVFRGDLEVQARDQVLADTPA